MIKSRSPVNKSSQILPAATIIGCAVIALLIFTVFVPKHPYKDELGLIYAGFLAGVVITFIVKDRKHLKKLNETEVHLTKPFEDRPKIDKGHRVYQSQQRAAHPIPTPDRKPIQYPPTMPELVTQSLIEDIRETNQEVTEGKIPG